MRTKILLACAALVAPAIGHAEWQEGSSKHFVIYADDTPAHVKQMTADLERFDKAVRTALNLKEPEVSPNARVKVFVLPALTDVQKMMGDRSGNVAGFYHTEGPGPIAVVPRHSSDDSERTLTPRQVLQHEYTHHVMYSSWGDVAFPAWFSEGFAEVFATARTRDDGAIVIGAVPLYRAYGIDRMNDLPVEQLVATAPDRRDGMQTQIFYGRSWLLTHYMMFDADRAKQLAAYIGAINRGASAADAAKALGLNSSTDIKLNSYGRRPALPARVFTAEQLPIGDVSVRALGPGEVASIGARMRSQNGVDQKRAQEVVIEARRAAAAFPHDAAALNELAEAEHDAGNFAASEAAADGALAADPKSVHAMLYKGMAMASAAQKAGKTDAATWTSIRRWYLAANKADPIYSFPVQLYYESFGMAKQEPTAAARNALLYAYKLAPQLPEVRLEAAREFLKAGETNSARVALEPIAFSAHGGPVSDMAKKAITALDSGGATAATKVIDAEEAKADSTDKKSGNKKS